MRRCAGAASRLSVIIGSPKASEFSAGKQWAASKKSIGLRSKAAAFLATTPTVKSWSFLMNSRIMPKPSVCRGRGTARRAP